MYRNKNPSAMCKGYSYFDGNRHLHIMTWKRLSIKLQEKMKAFVKSSGIK